MTHNNWKKYASNVNPWSLVTFTKRISQFVGIKFTLMLSSNYYITKGFAHSLIRSVVTPWYRQYPHIESRVMDVSSTVAMMPWSMKGFFGVISDNFALFGYSKTSYLIIYTIGGTVAACALAFVPDSILFKVPQVPGLLMFIIHCQGSAGDLYCEGKYVEKMKEIPEIKGDLVSYVWFCQMAGGLIPSFGVGVYSDHYNVKWLVYAMIPLVLQMLPFLMYGCMVNDKVESHLANKWNSKKYKAEWKMFTLGLLMGGFSVALSLMVFVPFVVQAIAAVVISIILCVLTWFWLNRVIAGTVIYLFFTTVLDIGTGGTATYWLLSGDDCVPGGPEFSQTFYFSIAPIWGTVFQFIGLWLFQIFIINLQIRTMFWLTNVLYIGSGFIGIMLYTRTNIAIGIPDEVFYIFTGAVLGTTFYMMNFMPSNILIAKVCPKGSEVTAYAILAGFSNFGQQVAAYIGIYLSQLFGIMTNPDHCNYDNFVLMVFLISLPSILEIVLVFYLIPKGDITTDFLGENVKIPYNNIAESTNKDTVNA